MNGVVMGKWRLPSATWLEIRKKKHFVNYNLSFFQEWKEKNTSMDSRVRGITSAVIRTNHGTGIIRFTHAEMMIKNEKTGCERPKSSASQKAEAPLPDGTFYFILLSPRFLLIVCFTFYFLFSLFIFYSDEDDEQRKFVLYSFKRTASMGHYSRIEWLANEWIRGGELVVNKDLYSRAKKAIKWCRM